MQQEQSSDAALTQYEYAEIVAEIEEQPHWRKTADKEMDYADGNQLDSELLRRMTELGIPPAVEDMIGPVLLTIQGYEKKTRTDWRVTPNGDPGGQDIADALNYKLNQAERESKADRACSKAFRPQIGCGIGWVEVARESDPFKYPYRCTAIHRNEMHWDMKAVEPDLSDARWLRRQRWMTPGRLALVFPQHKELIDACGTHGASWWGELSSASLDGGLSTGLQNAWNDGRAWTELEDRWYNPTTKEVCVAELWYRRWVRVPVLTMPDGRVVEYDEDNMAHNVALAMSQTRIQHATVARVRRSYWLGPQCLHDGPTPYAHRHYPYVPFFGFREDQTGVPYGYIRAMKYQQDSLNSGISKQRWGMSVTRVERTKGATAMTDAQLRRQIARPDADIVLDPEHMARPGARFDVKRDYNLTDQQHQLIEDARQAMQRISPVTAGFAGRTGTATSGLQEQTQVEQSTMSLGDVMDSFQASRSQVGELLLSMIVQDMGTNQHTIVIEGDAVRKDRSVVINAPEVDEMGYTYLSNDLQRTRLKVSLEDVPSSNSYRGMQLNAMSEAVKSLPAQYQAAVLPFMVSLMDVPFKRDVVEAVRAASAQESPEQIEQRIKQAIDDAMTAARNDLKERELDIKERKTDADIDLVVAKAVQTGVQSAFSAMQAAGQIAQMPQIAPIADVVMQGAGYKRPDPVGDDPNFPMPSAAAPGEVAPVRSNTSPTFPPLPDDGESPMTGIETATPADNFADNPV